MENDSIKELDTVAVTVDLTALGLPRGSVGTIVQAYSATDFEVEFVDTEGKTYALTTLKTEQLLRLRFDPVAAA